MPIAWPAPIPADASPSTSADTRIAGTRLTFNVKGEWRTVTLPPKAVLVGPNGSGKTAIVQALELALSGKCQRRGDGLLSRGVDLMALAPGGEKLLGVDALIEAGTRPNTLAAPFRFVVRGSVAKAETPSHATVLTETDYDTLFPVRRAAEALDGSLETVRKAVLSIVSERVDATTVKKALVTAGVTKLAFEAAGVEPRVLKPRRDENLLSALTRAVTDLDGHCRRLNAEAAALDATADSGVPDAGLAKAAQYEQELETARERLSRAVQAAAEAGQREVSVRAAFDRAKAAVPPAPAIPDHVRLGAQAAKAMRLIVEAHEAEAAKVGPYAPAAPRCPVCTWPLSVERLDRAVGEARRIAAVAKEAGEQAAPPEVAQLALDVIRAAAAHTAAREAVDDCRASVRTAETSLAAARETADAAANGAAQNAATARARAVACDSLRKRMHEARDAVLAEETDALAADLTRLSGLAVGVSLQVGQRDVAQVGIQVDDAPRRAIRTELSGAEWARLVSAFVSVQSGRTYRCVTIPDRQLDGESLALLCEAMSGAVDSGRVSQVLVQRVDEPVWLPEGWTMVDVERDVQPCAPPEWAAPAKRRGKGKKGDEADDEDGGSGLGFDVA